MKMKLQVRLAFDHVVSLIQSSAARSLFRATSLMAACAVLIAAFQNCSGGFSGPANLNTLGQSSSAVSAAVVGSCLFNGQIVSNGQSVTAFLSSLGSTTAPCQSQQRSCNNSVLSGTYQYGSCGNNQPQACLFNGQTLASGASVTAWLTSTVPAGQSCTSEVRTCTNGVLSGSASCQSCQPDSPAACLFNGQTVASGSTVPAYLMGSATEGNPCNMQTRTCSNGLLSGSYTYASCSPFVAASCQFGGVTLPSGSSTPAFQNSTVPFGQTCVSETRVCDNGQLSGSYSYTSCNPAQPQACLFNGQTIASGASTPAFQASTVPYGSSCVSQSRTCTNGTLSGSYTFANCNPASPAACTFNGQTIASGQTVQAFTSATVPFGSVCASVAQSHLCTNGTFSPTTPMIASCTVNAASPCTFLGRTLANGETTSAAYSSSTVPYGQNCSSDQATITCSNGNLSTSTGQPSSVYTSSSCNVQPGASCSFNGQTVSDGSSVTGNMYQTVANGQTCNQAQLTCTNGTLAGANLYPFANCSQENFTLSASTTNISPADKLQLSVSGGTAPYYWTGADSNGVFSGTPGTYTVTVRDSLSPSYSSATITITVTPYLTNTVYRHYNSASADFLFTTDDSEGVTVGYPSYGANFKLYAVQYPGTSPLYRCHFPDTGRHFVGPDCGYGPSDGILGYVSGASAYSANDSNALYLFSNYNMTLYSRGTYLTTVGTAEGTAAGFYKLTFLGYPAP